MKFSLRVTLTIWFGTFFLLVTSACFITNCPSGGKRSDPSLAFRQCKSCGPPGGGGRCYGPSICCLVNDGCYIGKKARVECAKEDILATPCRSVGAICSGDTDSLDSGQCASSGLCCSSETCTADEKCKGEKLFGPNLFKKDEHMIYGIEPLYSYKTPFSIFPMHLKRKGSMKSLNKEGQIFLYSNGLQHFVREPRIP